MDGASGVIALVLAETAVGTAAVTWLTGLWGNVKRGFFILTTVTALGCALLAAFSAAVAGRAGPGGARAAVVWGSVVSALLALSLVSLVLRQLPAARLFGLLSLPAGAVLLFGLATLGDRATALAAIDLVAGAAFMGAVMGGLLLGHWYLVDRRLARSHIKRLALILLGSIVVEAAVLAAGGTRGGIAPTGGFGPLITATGGSVWLVLVLGMVALTALLAVLIKMTLAEDRPRSVQAATGFFYLAVITAFTAELAAKVRFLE
ncbi:MAG TPA: hypothetical protein VGB51_02285 [Actinomycetota bacterium]